MRFTKTKHKLILFVFSYICVKKYVLYWNIYSKFWFAYLFISFHSWKKRPQINFSCQKFSIQNSSFFSPITVWSRCTDWSAATGLSYRKKGCKIKTKWALGIASMQMWKKDVKCQVFLNIIYLCTIIVHIIYRLHILFSPFFR